MFGKKPSSEASKSDLPNQLQSLSGITLNGSKVQLGQAGGDLVQSQSGDLNTQQQGLTGAEVVTLLEKLEAAVRAATLDADQKDAVLDYLRPAKREVAKPEPDKKLVEGNLKQVSETLKNLKDSTEAGKSLWKTGTEIFQAVAPWLGVAAHFFGL